jgi:hypothetical protein
MIAVAPTRMVTIELYATISGETEKSARRRMEEGIWIEGREYHRRGRNIFIDLEGVTRWVAGNQLVA